MALPYNLHKGMCHAHLGRMFYPAVDGQNVLEIFVRTSLVCVLFPHQSHV